MRIDVQSARVTSKPIIHLPFVLDRDEPPLSFLYLTSMSNIYSFKQSGFVVYAGQTFLRS